MLIFFFFYAGKQTNNVITVAQKGFTEKLGNARSVDRQLTQGSCE